MLEVTERAAAMIEDVRTDRGRPRAGLRIAGRDGGAGLVMALAESPEPGDVVVPVDRVAVFLDRAAVARLDTATLDARVTPEGAAFFL